MKTFDTDDFQMELDEDGVIRQIDNDGNCINIWRKEDDEEAYEEVMETYFPEEQEDSVESVRLSFKTPDVLDQLPLLSAKDREWIESFIKYGEYISVEFNLKNRTVSISR